MILETHSTVNTPIFQSTIITKLHSALRCFAHLCKVRRINNKLTGKNMASPKFGYWGLQGLGQPVRMLLAHQGVDHEDTVYTMEGSATWFEDHKLNMGLDFPNLPYYVDGDLKLTQSMAILRHLGREHGLYGQDNKEASKIDMIMDLAGDMRLGLARLAYNPDFENQKAKHIESMEPKFKQLSTFLEGKQFLMGEALTIADFTMHDAIAWHLKLDEELVKKYPNVLEYLERFRSQPKIKTFLEGDKAFELMFSPTATWNGK